MDHRVIGLLPRIMRAWSRTRRLSLDRQIADYRMVKRGNDMQQKETLLARLTIEAKKLGADALIDVRYKYYTSLTDNGYQMSGVAVKYRQECAVEQ